MDEMEYLEPSFDPASLTVPRLRNILMTHDIQYPASAKKAQLVDTFNQDLKPKARKLLSARDRVRRTSKGIINMPSSQESTVDGSEDLQSSAPPPSRSRPRTSRKTSRASTQERQSEETQTSSRTNPGVRSSSKHAIHSDTESDPDILRQAKKGRPRKRESSPRVKAEEQNRLPVRPPLPESAFSDENPFQSGSSPPNVETSRRRSAGNVKEHRKTSSTRRKTESIPNARVKQEDGIVVPHSTTFDIPVSALRKRRDESDAVQAGEEFTPEEQVELSTQQVANSKRKIYRPQKANKSKQQRIPKSAPWLIASALLVGYATWYRQEKFLVGYCGIGRNSDALSNVNVPDWASFLLPTCEPCPQHATCYEELVTRCDNDFVLKQHPLSLNGLLPLPPTCEPDGAKVRRVKAVADRAVETLRERKAKAECGNLKDAAGKPLPAEMPATELKKEVGKKRNRAMNAQEFDELWKDAIGEISGREEIVSSNDGTNMSNQLLTDLCTDQIPRRLLSSNSLARLPVACAIRRSAQRTLARNKQSLSLVILTISLIAYIRNRIVTSRADTARVPSLVATTLDRLATQAALHARGDAAEAWISVGQLRDDVLRDIFSDKRRESLWTRVRAIVERNANVRASVREGRGGDVSRVWEWIGSIGLIDDPYSDRRRSSGKRVSFGGLVEDGTPNDTTLDPEQNDGRPLIGGGGVQLRWDEGRPIY